MLVLRILALFFFLLGVVLLVRAFRAARHDAPLYLRAAAGSMAAAIGNLLLLRAPVAGLLFLLGGVWLIISARQARNL